MTSKITTPNNDESKPLGSKLKERRESLGLSLAEVANETRIRQSFLKALEEDRFSDLPGDTYVHGFLRNYAAALGLNKEEILAAYLVKVQKTFLQNPVPRKEGMDKEPRFSRRGLLLLLAAVVLLVALVSLGRVGLQVFQRNSVNVSNSQPVSSEAVPGGEEKADALENEAVSSTPVVPPSAAPSSSEVQTVEAATVFIPSGGAMIRARALATGWMEIKVDDRPVQRYQLQPDTVLNWRVGRTFRLEAGRPQLVALWLDEKPIELGEGTVFVAGPQP